MSQPLLAQKMCLTYHQVNGEKKKREMQGRTFILLFVRRRSQRHLFLFHRWDAFSFSHVKMPYVVH